MADWNNALRQRQGNITTGAATPGMGAGNIPHAPGMQQWQPQMAPPTQTHAPQQDLPQGAGNGSSMTPGMGAAPQDATGAPGGSQGQVQMDPTIMLRYASYLMQRFMRARDQGAGYWG